METSTLIPSLLPSFSRSSLRVCRVSTLGIEHPPQDRCPLLHLPCFADEKPGTLEGEVTQPPSPPASGSPGTLAWTISSYSAPCPHEAQANSVLRTLFSQPPSLA